MCWYNFTKFIKDYIFSLTCRSRLWYGCFFQRVQFLLKKIVQVENTSPFMGMKFLYHVGWICEEYFIQFYLQFSVKKSGTLIYLHWPTSGSVSFTIHFFEYGLNWNWNIIVEWRRFGSRNPDACLFCQWHLLNTARGGFLVKMSWLMFISELQTHLLSMKWVHFWGKTSR